MFTLIEAVGLVGGVITTASSLPQLIHTIITKDTKGINYIYLVMLFVGLLLWILYGFLIKDVIVVAFNIISALLIGTLILFKIYRECCMSPAPPLVEGLLI